MLAHHQNSDTVLYSSSQSKKNQLVPPMQSSPLLIITPHCNKESGKNNFLNRITSPQIQAGDCSDHEDNILEPMEIKELCQSPKSSRLSMFSFSPTPQSSPELQTETERNVYHSDDSSQSSPESTPLRLNKMIAPVSTDGRRYMVINELICTENKYINNLNTILSVFMPAFEHVVAARDLRLLIPAQLEMLVESHQDILKTLNQRIGKETEFHGFVGDIFSRLCGNSNMEFFNMYRVYMGEFKIAMRTLTTYETECPQFKEILNLLQHSPLCERLSLASYLLTPIQRLPRYELLLKELLKSTSVDHPDHYYLGEALSRLHKELTKLNLSIKSCQMACPNKKGSSKNLKGGSVSRRNSRRRPLRTMSMLRKKFVSATNIDEYSSGDASFTTDDIVKPPALRVPRRSNRLSIGTSPSFAGSDHNLSSSLGAGSENNTSHTMFRRGTLVHAARRGVNSRAVSCSDLLMEFNEEEEEESDDQEQKLDFPNLTPLVSENCTPNSSRHSSVYSRRNSYLYSSTSSLSSQEDSNKENVRDSSLTPTASPNMAPPTFTSTPTCLSPQDHDSKDSTLKLTDTKREKPDSTSEGSSEKQEEELESSVVVSEEVTVHRKKSSWRMNIFKRKKSGSKELKYIKQQET